MQDYLLPTVAYVGGPGELAYFAQSHVIYERLLGRITEIEAELSALRDGLAEERLAAHRATDPEQT